MEVKRSGVAAAIGKLIALVTIARMPHRLQGRRPGLAAISPRHAGRLPSRPSCRRRSYWSSPTHRKRRCVPTTAAAIPSNTTSGEGPPSLGTPRRRGLRWISIRTAIRDYSRNPPSLSRVYPPEPTCPRRSSSRDVPSDPSGYPNGWRDRGVAAPSHRPRPASGTAPPATAPPELSSHGNPCPRSAGPGGLRRPLP